MKHLRNIILTIAIAPAVFVFQSAQAQLLYEPFPTSYGDPSALGAGTSATVWNIGNGTGTQSVSNRAVAGLSYSGLQTSAGSLGAWVGPTTPTSNRNRGATFTETTSGSLYASFLVNVQAGTVNSNRMFAALSTNAIAGSGNLNVGIASVWLNSANQLQISKNNLTANPEAATTAALAAGTHLVVVRYNFDAVNPDDFSLWLDPGSLGGAAPGSDISITAGTDFAGLGSFFLTKTSAGWAQPFSSSLYVDEIRVGTTWAQVTPTSVPEPSVVAFLGVAAMGLITCYRRFRS